jgi:hypothetical protein
MGRAKIAVLASLSFLAGCGREAIDFNNQIAGIHAQLGEAVEEFGRTLHSAFDQEIATSADELAAAIERLRAAQATAKERSDQLRVPNLPQAAELYAAHQELLTWQRERLDEESAEIERLLGEPLPPGELPQRLRARFEAFKAAEAPRLEAMHAAQRRFAEAKGLKLTQRGE